TEVRQRSMDAWDDAVLVAEGGAGKGRVVRAGDDEPDLVRLDQGRFMPVLLDRFEEGLRRPVARPLRNHADLHRSFPTAGPRERARERKTCRARITRLTIYRRSPLGRRKGMGPVHSDTMRETKVDKRATIPVAEEVTVVGRKGSVRALARADTGAARTTLATALAARARPGPLLGRG